MVMVENELDVLLDVSGRLESAGIAFMLTGSLALNYYAQPRMTRFYGNEVSVEAFIEHLRSKHNIDSR